MPNWAQNGPKWSKTCYIDHLGSFWALLDRFGTSASLPCSAIFGPKRAIMIRGSQKGGGSDVWEKFPNNIVFFVWQRTLAPSSGGFSHTQTIKIYCPHCSMFDMWGTCTGVVKAVTVWVPCTLGNIYLSIVKKYIIKKYCWH